MVGGCGKTSENNDIKIVYKNSNKKEQILLGANNSTRQVNNFSFSGNIVSDDKNYTIEGKVIFKDSIAKSTIKINVDDIEIYLRDKKVYIGYMYNNTNIIVRDDLDVFLEELVLILNNKGAKCNLDQVKDIVYNKSISDIDFSKLEYFGKREGEYSVGDDNYKIELNTQYLPTKVEYIRKNTFVDIKFNYGEIGINIPLGYDIFPLSIGQVKSLLRISSLVELF